MARVPAQVQTATVAYGSSNGSSNGSSEESNGSSTGNVWPCDCQCHNVWGQLHRIVDVWSYGELNASFCKPFHAVSIRQGNLQPHSFLLIDAQQAFHHARKARRKGNRHNIGFCSIMIFDCDACGISLRQGSGLT